MAKKIRVHELAKELGLSNKETLDLAVDLGIGVKSHSSSIEAAKLLMKAPANQRDKTPRQRAYA